MSTLSTACAVTAAACALAWPAVSAAQNDDPPLTIQPRGGSPAPSPSPSPSGPGPAQQGGDNAGDNAGGDVGIDYGVEPIDQGESGLRHVGVVPELHVVRGGDTLWDICDYYFNNPWEWPKIWSYNPSITNPHWIYPGDLVRLYPPGEGPPTAVNEPGENPDPIKVVAPGGGKRSVELRQVAFVTDEEMQFAGTIIGSPEEKMLLGAGDEVYLEYPEGQPPQIGKRYAIYASDDEPVKHPVTKAVVGSYVELKGEVKILEVKKGRKARGLLTYSTDVIERGMRVGPTRTQFKEVAPVAADQDLEGVVIAVLATENIMGENQIVFIDRGQNDGVKVGNVFRVVRRGDAYNPKMGPSGNAGLDDRTYPDDTIGVLIVVEVGKSAAVAFMVDSTQEIEIGDHVLMRASQ